VTAPGLLSTEVGIETTRQGLSTYGKARRSDRRSAGRTTVPRGRMTGVSRRTRLAPVHLVRGNRSHADTQRLAGAAGIATKRQRRQREVRAGHGGVVSRAAGGALKRRHPKLFATRSWARKPRLPPGPKARSASESTSGSRMLETETWVSYGAPRLRAAPLACPVKSPRQRCGSCCRYPAPAHMTPTPRARPRAEPRPLPTARRRAHRMSHGRRLRCRLLRHPHGFEGVPGFPEGAEAEHLSGAELQHLARREFALAAAFLAPEWS
jgi:hypothetical protein